ncbi:MAG: O-antigen ligase [Nevskia sp.]|nr:O-antigen ligase [Nevskia sp.]
MEYIQQFSLLFFILLVAFGDWLNPAVAFALPWTFILGASQLNLLVLQRDIGYKTLLLIASNIAIAFFINWSLKPAKVNRHGGTRPAFVPRPSSGSRMAMLTLVAAFIALIDIVYSGGLPLVALVTGVGPTYKEFGVPSLNGLLVALVNCLCCIAMTLYLLSRNRKYLYYVFLFIFWHIFVISRENILLLLTELGVIYFTFKQKRPNRIRALIVGVVFLAAFTVAGGVRSGDIYEATGVAESASSYPRAFVWLYMYSVANVYSIDSVIDVPPHLGLSFVNSLIPTFLRVDDLDAAGLIERWQEGAVFSYIPLMYLDIGFWGVLGFTALMFVLTFNCYYKSRSLDRPLFVLIYPVLFYSAFMSFFVNYWLYLPVISQIILFSAIAHLFFKTPRKKMLFVAGRGEGIDQRNGRSGA